MGSEAPIHSQTLSLQHSGAGEDAYSTLAAGCLHRRCLFLQHSRPGVWDGVKYTPDVSYVAVDN